MLTAIAKILAERKIFFVQKAVCFIMKKIFSFLSIIIILNAVFLSCSSGTDENNGSDDFPSQLAEYVGNQNYISPKNVEISLDAVKNQSSGLNDSWWRETNFYHIWVKSFADSDDDGCGDFKGIENKLSYIKDDLGCDGIWLSPIFECDYKSKEESFNMHGYDVKDYYAVNSYFGTEDDLISLINACHKKGIKIIFDFVPNHSSSGNQWFKDSCNNENGKKYWYVWNDTPLNWNTGMGLSGWTYNAALKQYYWHAFADSQPDLNFRNYEVREEMKNVVRYWLNKGFDGLRVDAVRYLIETENAKYDTAETHKWFQELRSEVDKYKENGLSPKFMVCEAWITNDRPRVEKYFGTETNPEFNMVFDFDQGYGIVNSINYKDASILSSSLFANPSGTQTYGTFLGNHDEYLNRLGTFFRNYKATIKLAAAMSLLRPTTPFIYYGNEIGMEDDTTYGSGDIRHRTKFDWEQAEKQKSNKSSILNLNKAILALRKTYPKLFANGKVEFLQSNTVDEKQNLLNDVVAYTISDGTDSLLCIFSLANQSDNFFWFSNSNLVDVENYSVLIGINDEKNLSTEEGSFKVKYIAPYEARVYYLGDSSKEMLFTDNRLFLRGDMNGWGYDEMFYDSANKTFFVEKELLATTYQFKFDNYADWTKSYGSGEENPNGKTISLGVKEQTSTTSGENTNFALTLQSAGTYKFTFFLEDGTFDVTKK